MSLQHIHLFSSIVSLGFFPLDPILTKLGLKFTQVYSNHANVLAAYFWRAAGNMQLHLTPCYLAYFTQIKQCASECLTATSAFSLAEVHGVCFVPKNAHGHTHTHAHARTRMAWALAGLAGQRSSARRVLPW